MVLNFYKGKLNVNLRSSFGITTTLHPLLKKFCGTILRTCVSSLCFVVFPSITEPIEFLLSELLLIIDNVLLVLKSV